jgi:hypothetical protein
VKFEENCLLNRKWLISFAAVACAALLPLAAAAQLAPERPAKPEDPDAALKWKAYVGAGYTSLNQVNQSRYGLIGVNVGVVRDFGRFFGVTAEGAFYNTAAGSGNPGNPSVDLVLAGPEIHGAIFERWNLFGRVLLGGAHTGGTDQSPDISFAGGFGGGAEYKVARRIFIRISGDDIASSFTLTGASTQNGYSPHMRWNPRGGLGVAYRF